MTSEQIKQSKIYSYFHGKNIGFQQFLAAVGIFLILLSGVVVTSNIEERNDLEKDYSRLCAELNKAREKYYDLPYEFRREYDVSPDSEDVSRVEVVVSLDSEPVSRDEEYEKLNSELESLVDKTISKLDEIIKELDKDGTILGKISIDDLASKVDAINNIYTKFEGKIDSALGKLADIEKGSVSGKFDTKYWEDILFGEDDDNRFDIDDILDGACPKLGNFRVNDPYTDNNRRLVIDEFKVKGGGATVTFDRYLN